MAITGVTECTNSSAAGRTNRSGSLGGEAQAYLNGLKEKYPDVNITVADFHSEKQSDAYMLGSRGYNNIAVSSGILEEMASDPAAAAKYEKVFAEMSVNAERVEKFARESGDEIFGAGAVIDRNGKVSYWMVGRSRDTIENPGTVYKEKVQKQIAEKRAKKKEEEALKKKRLEKAESLEKLLEKTGNRMSGNESAADGKIKEAGRGEQIDLSV